MLVRSAPTPRRKKEERQVKKTKKKEIEGQKTKTPIPTRTIDALIGDEEQDGNQKKKDFTSLPGFEPSPFDEFIPEKKITTRLFDPKRNFVLT